MNYRQKDALSYIWKWENPTFLPRRPFWRLGSSHWRRDWPSILRLRVCPLYENFYQNYQDQYGVAVAPRRIFLTSGGSGALLLATALTLNQGEGLLMSDPGYPCNRHFLKSFGAEAQLVPVSADVGFQLDLSLVQKHWKENTRGVLLASPANPTGAIIQPDVLPVLPSIRR